MSATYNRPLQRPRLPAMPQQCASCPFRADNPEAFGRVVVALRKSIGLPALTTMRAIAQATGFARAQIHDQCASNVEFHCHGTVYDGEMKMKPISEHRQCPGATEWHRKMNT